MKVITTEGAPSAERLRRFGDEARAVASLSHPNVLTVFDVGAREGEPYVVFELLEGETLRHLREYFDVEEEPERVVKMRAVGRKDRNRVLIGGEEVELR